MQPLIDPIEYYKIDKISDDVYAIASNIILKFNVSLSKISGGKRYHYHREYEYPSKNTPETPTLVTIKRSFDYYLSIESQQKDSNGNKLFIRIGPQEYLLLKNGLETATSWFTDKKYAKLYARDKGKLVILPPIPEVDISKLPMQKSIAIYPTIISRGLANADDEPGVEFTFGDTSISFTASIDINRLMGLYYIISCFNMYQAALEVVNYVQRPDFGTNRFVMETQRILHNEDAKEGSTGITDRIVTPKGIKNNISMLEG